MNKNDKFLIYLNRLREDWIVDRTRDEWYKNNKDISTKFVSRAEIVWLIAPWNWTNVDIKNLNKKKVLCSIYHIDEEKFSKEEELKFHKRDKFVNEYHVISKKTKAQVRELTDKKITSIPFWVNSDIWFEIKDKNKIKEKFKLDNEKFYIGSFQRDSEGSDLTKPKLSKGPDRFIEIVSRYKEDGRNIHVILSGKRRNFLINELDKLGIDFSYFEMVNFETLNELYNCLDLYIVSSRFEGGPQSILECGITKTPIISTDVGVASEILSPESIFNMENYFSAKPNIEVAFNNSVKYKKENIFNIYKKMFQELYES
tara:strand:+ start:802 stop:1743 length:942 start_codon:yes stop_codon:yes gene_type:complete